MSTWTGPAWATHEEEVHGGIRWTRRPTTAVAAADEGPSSPGDPFKVEAAVYDFLTVIGPSVLVERQPVQIFVDGIVLDLNGARDLITALTEVVEAVEEGTR